MEKRISFSKAMQIIDRVDKSANSIPFDIAFRTLNRNSKKGGRLLIYRQVKKHRPKKSTLSRVSLLASVHSGCKVKRNPNHQNNRTRLLELQNGELKKIHIRLIDSVNGKKMHY
tara:strand:- start:1475 stop:1816 length:342 start_codon:yes stop_codon:yes gene_type:complete